MDQCGQWTDGGSYGAGTGAAPSRGGPALPEGPSPQIPGTPVATAVASEGGVGALAVTEVEGETAGGGHRGAWRAVSPSIRALSQREAPVRHSVNHAGLLHVDVIGLLFSDRHTVTEMPSPFSRFGSVSVTLLVLPGPSLLTLV